ncbi:anti-sigma factor [Pedobacter sp. SD-b]|uniref:Anti-sigma factor n=1 Tax=Pedobacter segetis TaxID=2793069 RepID=A0ABS1BIT0_9SPHI|nr:anti-sigma factor [Pedobacter segetis]MBK0382792.1 anti-sigma factor [Pedobacter segetis]
MENIKSYIESGILELYVLGDLAADERSEVEAMSKLHPEVKAELGQIESVMQSLADSLQVLPSEKVRTGFLNSISFSDEEEIIAPVAKQQEAKVVALTKNYTNFYKYAFAASVALLLVSLVAIISLNNSLKNSKQQIAALQSSNQSFANKVNYLDQQVTKTTSALDIYSNPDVKMVKLEGTANAKGAKIMVAFNPKTNKVGLDMKSMDMPKNDADHQYQLWALVDGKPVDLGVFDIEGNQIGFKNMKEISKAQTFAVTLEPRGGSINPTMDKLMVMGNI